MPDPDHNALRFDEVLRGELQAINARREANFERYQAPSELHSSSHAPFEDIRRFALDHDLVGLAFSGGGIRSATFNLGILQGLARHGTLRFVDYLSTVSGGGYTGAWLSAWIKREASLSNVEMQLSPERAEEAGATRYAASPGEFVRSDQVLDDEPEPVRHLRAYSRYLAPRFGLLTPDAWTLRSEERRVGKERQSPRCS